MAKLTPKQERFVEEYLTDLNASAAALRAGYASGDIGRQLITKPHVQAAVAAAKGARSERTLVTADEVVAGLKAEAAYAGEGSSHGARVAAWGWLGRHLGMFVDRVKHEGAVTLEVTEEIVDASGGPHKAV
jgi:phage terminase small subunit